MQYLDERSSLEDKLVEKLLSGFLERPLINAWEDAESKDPGLIRETFRQKLRAALGKLPRDTVQDDIENIKGQLEMTGRNALIGIVQSQVDPGVDRIKVISRDIAEKIIWCRTYIEIIEPVKNDIIEILNTYIAEHKAPRREFWKDREVDFLLTEGLHPVIIGIWDTGVDVNIFRDQLFGYNAERPSGRYSGNHSAANDLHGIAFDLNEEKTMGLLYPLSYSDVKRLPQVKDYIKGITDIQAAVDSREARAMKKKIGAMQPEEVKPLMEEVTLFT